jgi:hypothetical protein
VQEDQKAIAARPAFTEELRTPSVHDDRLAHGFSSLSSANHPATAIGARTFGRCLFTTDLDGRRYCADGDRHAWLRRAPGLHAVGRRLRHRSGRGLGRSPARATGRQNDGRSQVPCTAASS